LILTELVAAAEAAEVDTVAVAVDTAVASAVVASVVELVVLVA